MDKQREEFEEAFKNNNAYNIELIHGTNTPTFEQNSKGEYLKISVQNHWEMWQQAQKVVVAECKWIPCYDGSVFNTNCGHTFELSNNDSLADNNMRHCCFCGGLIEAQEDST